MAGMDPTRATFYPENAARRPACDHLISEARLSGSPSRPKAIPEQRCNKRLGHEGYHSDMANWNAHLEIDSTAGGIIFELRHNHGYGAMSIGSRQEGEALVTAIRSAVEARWPALEDGQS